MKSGDVGCVATSAQRHLAGKAPDVTALVVAAIPLAHSKLVITYRTGDIRLHIGLTRLVLLHPSSR